MPGAVAERENAVFVEGLRELRTAFKVTDKALVAGFREVIEAAGEPIKSDAQDLARSRILGISRQRDSHWDQMRVGISGTIGWVAPVERGVKSKGRDYRRRPKFKTTLLDMSLDPALEGNAPRVEKEFQDALEDLAKAWERV